MEEVGGLDAPANVHARATDRGILVNWTDTSDNEEGFELFRSIVGGEGGAPVLLATLPAETEHYLDTSPEVGITYVYSVETIGEVGNSDPTLQSNDPVTFTGRDDVPGSGDEGDPGGGESGDDDPGGDGGSAPNEPGDGAGDDGEAGGGDAGGEEGGGDAGGDGGDAGDGDGDGSGDVPIIVTTTSEFGSEGECTLRDAIEAANRDEARGGCNAGSGADTIILLAAEEFILTSTYEERDGPNGLPSIRSAVSIDGNGSTLRRDGDIDAFRLFHVGESGELRLFDMTIRTGDGGEAGGGAVYIASGADAFLSNLRLDANKPGAVFNAGRLELEDSLLANNGGDTYTSHTSYAFHNAGAAILSRVTITDNQAAGIFNEADAVLDLIDSAVTQNLGASAFVGGVINEGKLTAIRTSVDDNTSYDSIGGIVNHGELTFDDGSISGNFGVDAGAGLVNYEGATAVIRRTLVSDNLADFAGAGLVNEGSMFLADVTVERNVTDGHGAGIYIPSSAADPELSITGNSVIANNTAVRDGAGIYVANGRVAVDDTTSVRENEARRHGGGIYLGSSGHLTLGGGVSVTDNVADSDGDGDGTGGGVYVESGATFDPGGASIENNTPNDVFTD